MWWAGALLTVGLAVFAWPRATPTPARSEPAPLATASDGSVETATATLAVITVVEANRADVGTLLASTHDSLRGQTAAGWRWHVWTDGSELERSFGHLARDDRIVLRRGPPASGACGLRNAALVDVLADAGTRFVTFVEPGDAFVPTAFEKSLWMLESVKNWAFVSSCACLRRTIGAESSLHLGRDGPSRERADQRPLRRVRWQCPISSGGRTDVGDRGLSL